MEDIECVCFVCFLQKLCFILVGFLKKHMVEQC
jgi:hypothetical protein